MSTYKYNGRLFPVTAGQLISVVGKVANNPHRLDINLTSANEHGIDAGDVQLHISVRFNAPEPVVVRNTHSRGVGWAVEERRENVFPFNSLNPVQRGGDFKIDIFVDQVAYFISIDGKPYCTFSHRLPFHTIQFLNVSRDVETIYQVNQTNAQARPWPVVNPNTFEAFVPGQFNPGNVVIITGTPKGNHCGDFSVNFYDGSNRFRTHFHLRAYLHQRNIILNSQNECEGWHQGNTICPQPYPFNLHQTFKLAIAITNCEFQIAANGRRIASYPFRDHQQRVLGSMTGIALISGNGLNVDVQSVDYKNLDCMCNGFENFSKI